MQVLKAIELLLGAIGLWLQTRRPGRDDAKVVVDGFAPFIGLLRFWKESHEVLTRLHKSLQDLTATARVAASDDSQSLQSEWLLHVRSSINEYQDRVIAAIQGQVLNIQQVAYTGPVDVNAVNAEVNRLSVNAPDAVAKLKELEREVAFVDRQMVEGEPVIGLPQKTLVHAELAHDLLVKLDSLIKDQIAVLAFAWQKL